MEDWLNRCLGRRWLTPSADCAYCVLVGLEKIKVKERPEPKEEY